MGAVRTAFEGLMAGSAGAIVGVCGHYAVAQYLQYGRWAGYDAEGASYVLAFGLFAVPALIASLWAVRAIVSQHRFSKAMAAAVGTAAGAAACWSIFSFYAVVVFPAGLGFVWPLPLLMGGVAGPIAAILWRVGDADGAPVPSDPSA